MLLFKTNYKYKLKILIEYYFEIKYVKNTNNIKVNTLSKKAELQGSKKPLDAILCIDKDGKIKYNYPKLAAVYKVLKLY